jgi:hypothetical protein
MISPPAAGPLAVAETDLIAALLAELSGRGKDGAMPTPARGHGLGKVASSPAIQVEPVHKPSPVDVTQTISVRPSVRQLLEEANWRNAAPEPVAPAEAPERPQVAEVGPLPAPFGVLSVATLFGLVNWRNQPDEVRPLPIIQPPPPPGAEFTVAAMMPTFGWE